jgi:hypothetical protein
MTRPSVKTASSPSRLRKAPLFRRFPHCSPAAPSALHEAQDFKRGIPGAVRDRHPASATKIIAHSPAPRMLRIPSLSSNSSSTIRPEARPYHTAGTARPRRLKDRMRGRDLPSRNFVFSELRSAGPSYLATGKNSPGGIQGIFLSGILPDHLRGLHSSIFTHSFQPIWSSN